MQDKAIAPLGFWSIIKFLLPLMIWNKIVNGPWRPLERIKPRHGWPRKKKSDLAWICSKKWGMAWKEWWPIPAAWMLWMKIGLSLCRSLLWTHFLIVMFVFLWDCDSKWSEQLEKKIKITYEAARESFHVVSMDYVFVTVISAHGIS